MKGRRQNQTFARAYAPNGQRLDTARPIVSRPVERPKSLVVGVESRDRSTASELTGYGGPLVKGFIILLILVFGLGGWAKFTTIHGAVVATGVLVVEGKPKSVQHLDGGIIDAIHVANGDKVQAGDLLISLSKTAVDATLRNLDYQDISLHAQIARLESERAGHSSIKWPPLIQKQLGRAEVKTAMADQRELFRTRQDLFQSRVGEIESTIKQNRSEITATRSLIQSESFKLQSWSQDLDRLKFLQRSNAVSIHRVTSVERDVASAQSEITSLKATIDRLEEEILEAEAQRRQLEQDRQEQILTKLAEYQDRLVELREEYSKVSDAGERSDIRATIDGVIHNLQFTSEKGVISGAQEIMQIVPVGGQLLVESRINPKDIDQIQFNQAATMTLSAFHPSRVPQLTGEVVKISPDLLIDDATGEPYFNVSIAFTRSELDKLSESQLVPGMPVDAFIQTEKTTVLRYVLKPITTALGRTFREE